MVWICECLFEQICHSSHHNREKLVALKAKGLAIANNKIQILNREALDSPQKETERDL